MSENNEATLLNTKFAIKNLYAINKAIKLIENQAKTTNCDILLSMYIERTKLINTDPNYKEAWEILKIFSLDKLENYGS